MVWRGKAEGQAGRTEAPLLSPPTPKQYLDSGSYGPRRQGLGGLLNTFPLPVSHHVPIFGRVSLP